MTHRVLVLLAAAATALPAQEPVYRDPGMKTLVQVAIVCKDIEATSARWAELLGVPKPKINTSRVGREVKELYRGRPSDGRAKLAFIKTGQVVIELIEPVGGDTSWREHLDKHGEGVQHVGFQVVDLEKSLEAMKRLGYSELHRGRYDADNGSYVYLDTGARLGTTVELLHSDPKK